MSKSLLSPSRQERKGKNKAFSIVGVVEAFPLLDARSFSAALQLE
jgi:hypothetical protein